MRGSARKCAKDTRLQPPQSCCALADLPPKGHTTARQEQAVQRIDNFPGEHACHCWTAAYPRLHPKTGETASSSLTETIGSFKTLCMEAAKDRGFRRMLCDGWDSADMRAAAPSAHIWHNAELTGPVQDVYKSWDLPERAPRPPAPPRVTQPFDATSAYQENYPAHEPQPRWKRQQETWKGRTTSPHFPCAAAHDPCIGCQALTLETGPPYIQAIYRHAVPH